MLMAFVLRRPAADDFEQAHHRRLKCQGDDKRRQERHHRVARVRYYLK